ncbi:MAG: CBS domain-containing protein [Sulfolobaceae archaeon]
MSLQVEGSEIISLNSNAYVIDVLYFMRRNNIRRLVVSDSNKIIGVFTVEDALRYILENRLEAKLSEIKLRKPIIVNSNYIKDIIDSMIKNNSDFVIYRNKYIITEKDIIKNFNWNLINQNVENISKEAIVVEPFTKISTCIEIMLKSLIRHLPVVERIPIGIISARDIVYSYDSISINNSVDKIMKVDLVKVNSNTEVRNVVELMIKRNIGSVIVNSGKSVRILTNRDLIRLAHKYLL